jgi:NTP pyrophosphatase (non-canonical NTP hydrolase)
MTEIQRLQTDVKEWSDKQFGPRNGWGIAHHLRLETGELIEALHDIYSSPYTIPSDELSEKLKYEYADILILLIDSAAHEGIDMETLILYSQKKLEINKTRKWGNPNENGVIEHIEEPKTIKS